MAELQVNFPDYAQNAIAAQQAGRQMGLQQARQNALAIAPTDPAAAQSALLGIGDIQSANELSQYQAQQTQLKARAAAAPMVKSGDYTGAARAATAGGDADYGAKLLQMGQGERDLADQKATKLGGIAYNLLTVADPAKRQQLWQQTAPHLVEQGLLKPEDIPHIDISDNGLKSYVFQAQTLQQQIAQANEKAQLTETARHNQADETNAAGTLKEKTANDRTMAGIESVRAKADLVRAGAEGWQILQDPTTGAVYRYNSRTGQSTTQDGSQPYTPSGAGHIAGTPRTAAAAATARFLSENPNATADDLAQFNAKYRSTQAATTAFAVGKQGQTVNSINVGISHLNTLGGLADALGNGSIPLLNQWANTWKTQTGSAAPTNLNAAKQVVGAEIVKAVTAGGGGVTERQEAEHNVNAASSPAQLKGVIDTYKQLLAGQLGGLKLQYKNATGADDFDTHLAPETRAELENQGANAGGAPKIGAVQKGYVYHGGNPADPHSWTKAAP